MKHGDFLRSHDIRLKKVTLERYSSNSTNTSFVRFFMLNVRALLSMRIKFSNKKSLTARTVEQHKKKFQVDKRASECVGLLFTTTFFHVPTDFLARDFDFKDQTDPFDCDYRKLWLN